MGSRAPVGDQFKERLRAERKRREWSQEDLASMLSDRGINVYSTTIAKIEAGDRAVRIDELTALADLFDMSLDALLGRSSGGQLLWATATLKALARAAANNVGSTVANVSAALGDVRHYADQPDAAPADRVISDAETALQALIEAQQALTALAQTSTPGITIHPLGRSRKR